MIQANFIYHSEVILMQDMVPSNMANLVQNWSGNHIKAGAKNFWPPSQPDLNLLDFSIWANILAMIKDSNHPNTNALRASITKVWNNMSMAEVRKVSSRVRPRIKAMVKAKEGYID